MKVNLCPIKHYRVYVSHFASLLHHHTCRKDEEYFSVSWTTMWLIKNKRGKYCPWFDDIEAPTIVLDKLRAEKEIQETWYPRKFKERENGYTALQSRQSLQSEPILLALPKAYYNYTPNQLFFKCINWYQCSPGTSIPVVHYF